MRHFYTLVFLAIFFPFFSSAQSNYKPGYVVALNGDTLKGYVDYREWEKNPEKISFKNNLNNDQGTIFTAKNSTAFAINGYEYFRRYKVTISQAQVQFANIKQGIDTNYITDVVFLRTLATGNNVSLFSYTDNIKTRYYILDAAETQPRELVYRIYYAADNFSFVQTQNRYRDQLAYLAQKYNVNSQKLRSEIYTADYSEHDIIKITQSLNGDKIQQFTPASRLGTRWYCGLGVTDNIMSFTGAIKFPGHTSIFPEVSAGFDLFPNKNTRKLFLRGELSFSSDQHSFSNQADAIGHSYSISNFTQRTISFAPQLIYNIYNSDKFKFFIGAGISANLSSYSNYYFKENFNVVGSTITNNFPEFNHFWFSFPIKAGVMVNERIEIYAGYTFSTILTDGYDTFDGDITTYHAGINYLFGVK